MSFPQGNGPDFPNNQPRQYSDSNAGPWSRWILTHPLVTFFVLTFTLSWGYWVIVLGFLGHQSLWWFLPGAFAPFVAATFMTGRLEGRHGIRVFMRRFLRWRVGLRWYLVALVAFPLLAVLSGLFLHDGSEQYQDSGAELAVTYVALVLFLTVLGGGQEEPGWRGFALPRLQERYGPLVGTILLGLLWGLWHLPLFVFVPGYNFSGPNPSDVLLTFALFVVAGCVGQSLLLTWLFNNTGGSILLAMLAHGSFNASQGLAASTQQATITVFLVLALAGAIVAFATRGRLGYQKTLPPAGSLDQPVGQ